MHHESLRYLTADDRNHLFDGSTILSVDDNHTIIAEYDTRRSIFLISKGRARVERSQLGHTVQIATLREGEIFGEMSLLEDRWAAASVIADGPVELRAVEQGRVQALLDTLPGFAGRFYRSLAVTLSERLREFEDRILGVQVLRREDGFENDPSLRQQLADILAPSYHDARPLLERELHHCDTLYVYREDERPCFFFMIAWETIKSADGEVVPAVYLGLSAAARSFKNSGAIRSVYTRALADCMDWQRRTARELVGWGTTATPSAYFAAELLTGHVEPRRDGSFSEEGRRIVTLIREQAGYGPPSAGEHPFVLRGVAEGTRYSPDERARVSRGCREKNFPLFDVLGVREEDGDRLLFLARRGS